MSEPLSPISSPFALLAKAGITPSAHEIGLWLFVLVLVFWALYTAIAIYHWVRYSHASLVAVPSIITHLVVSGVLILFAASGLI